MSEDQRFVSRIAHWLIVRELRRLDVELAQIEFALALRFEQLQTLLQSSDPQLEQRMQLQRFAALTGGQAFFPTSVKEVDKMYDKIQKEIAARYSLGYTSTDERTDGAWRPVEIRLKKDVKGAKLRTRDGYFAPYRK